MIQGDTKSSLPLDMIQGDTTSSLPLDAQGGIEGGFNDAFRFRDARRPLWILAYTEALA